MLENIFSQLDNSSYFGGLLNTSSTNDSPTAKKTYLSPLMLLLHNEERFSFFCKMETYQFFVVRFRH